MQGIAFHDSSIGTPPKTISLVFGQNFSNASWGAAKKVKSGHVYLRNSLYLEEGSGLGLA